MRYTFYYDETEHSRSINYATVTAENYYDSFIVAIVGWPEEKNELITKKYQEFENKYEYRKVDGELKSRTMKSKDFRIGFASLNRNTIKFYEDFLSVLEDDVIVYCSVFSKMEYLIDQLFREYRNSSLVDMDSAKYSIIKAINVYRPRKLIQTIYDNPQKFPKELRAFLEERISRNEANLKLKEYENRAFKEIIELLGDVKAPITFEWSYVNVFTGFDEFLKELHIENYSLIIDREGNRALTQKSAIEVGLKGVVEGDSKDYIGIRMADMFAGLVSRFMQSLGDVLIDKSLDGKPQKKLIDEDWFVLEQRQLDLYKKLYRILFKNYKSWSKIYAGKYTDDLVAFLSLIQFMNMYTSVDKIRSERKNLPEYFNTVVCEQLADRFRLMRNKLPIEVLVEDGKDYYLNQRGAKVYKDVEKQPILIIREGQNKYYVLSVGFGENGTILATIMENGEPCCYRLPSEYRDWVIQLVGMANLGDKLLPSEVVFSLVNGSYYADIL